MRKTLTLVLCLLSFFQVQAQNRYYVANNNGTYQAITIDETHQMEFDAEQKLIAIKLVDGAVSTFATEKHLSMNCQLKYGVKRTTKSRVPSTARKETGTNSIKKIIKNRL